MSGLRDEAQTFIAKMPSFFYSLRSRLVLFVILAVEDKTHEIMGVE